MELVPLCRLDVTLGSTELVVDGPLGNLIIGPIASARFEGERLQASLRGASAADWMTLGPDGTVDIDVRLSLRTDDGAFLFMTYRGRADWSDGIGSAPTYAAPVFETDDPRYAWLNSVQCVGKGTVTPPTAVYEIFELR